MKKLILTGMIGLMAGLAQAQSFGTDTPPNPSPGRPEGAVPGGGAGAPVAEGAIITMALAAGYAAFRHRKQEK